MAPRNPFRPSFGITPTVVVGRELVTMNVGLALLEGPGSPYGFTLVSGPRGSGKTVLLNLLEEEARYRGWTVLRVTSSHDMVDDLVATDIPALLRDITGKKTRRIVTGGSVAGIGSVTTQAESDFPSESPCAPSSTPWSPRLMTGTADCSSPSTRSMPHGRPISTA